MNKDRKPAYSIPTPEQFASANRIDAQRMRHLEDIRTSFWERFSTVCPLDEFVIMPQIDVNFRAFIFFEKDADIAKYEASGISQAMRDFVYDKLEEFGRGKRGEITVAFEFDSLENVQKNFEGNYYLRLH